MVEDLGVQIAHVETARRAPMRLDRGTQVTLVDGLKAAGLVDAHVNILKVGSAPGPYHCHRHVENFYLVLEGVLTLRVQDETFELPRGSSVLIPPNVPHSATNLASVPLELLEIYVPAHSLPDFELVPDG